MPALNFQAWKARLVESGQCRQTIRAYRKDGRDPEPGDILYLYAGMRTRNCRLLRTATVTEIKTIQIDKFGAIFLDRHRLSLEEEIQFVGADGFEDPFVGWLILYIERIYGLLPFRGLVIRW